MSMKKQVKKNKSRSAQRDDRERINPVPWIIGALAIVLLIAGILLYDFLSNYAGIISFKQNEDGSLVDSKNSVTYIAAPSAYKASLWVKDPQYARLGKLPLYQLCYRNADEKVVVIDGLRYVTTDNDNGAILYYNSKEVTLPTLADFEHDISRVCSVDGVVFARAELTKTQTRRIVTALTEESGVSVSGKVKEKYELRIASSKYDWLTYCLEFTVTEDGGYFITDTISGKTVMGDALVFDEFFGEPKAN